MNRNRFSFKAKIDEFFHYNAPAADVWDIGKSIFETDSRILELKKFFSDLI